MFIETYHRGVLINRFEISEKLDMEEIEFAVVYESSMKEGDSLPALPKVKRLPIDITRPPVKKTHVHDIPKVIPIQLNNEPIVREKAVFSNSRPYDQLHDF